MIYVLSTRTFGQTRSYKIGYSKNVEKRIRSLQTGNPLSIRFEFSVEGSLRQEKTIHHWLQKLGFGSSGSEWYAETPFLVTVLEELRLCVAPVLGLLETEALKKAHTEPATKKTEKVILKAFQQCGFSNHAVSLALTSIQSDTDLSDVRSIERLLRRHGASQKASKKAIHGLRVSGVLK